MPSSHPIQSGALRSNKMKTDENVISNASNRRSFVKTGLAVCWRNNHGTGLLAGFKAGCPKVSPPCQNCVKNPIYFNCHREVAIKPP
jgi:hypothetical protein